MLDEFCPDCGAHRIALFRWCRICGLDFDELDALGELPGGPYSPLRPEDQATSVEPGSAPRSVQVTDRTIRTTPRRLGRYIPVGIAAMLIIGVVGALAIGAGGPVTSAVLSATDAAAPAPGPSTPPAAIAPGETRSEPTPEPLAPMGATTFARVTRIVDGDTIIVSIGNVEYRVRYIGIDAPEAVDLDRPVEFMATEAADANRQLVSSATVILERDTSETDQHGQLLRNVWVRRDGRLTLVALELVRAGLARTSTFSEDVRYRSELVRVQQEARFAGRGIWGPPVQVETGVLPAPIETALPRLVGTEPVAVYGSRRTEFKGGVGIYTWRSVSFVDPQATVRWDIRSTAVRACHVEWRVEPADVLGWIGTATVSPNDRATGRRVENTAFSEALLTVTSTCPDWHISLQGSSGS